MKGLVLAEKPSVMRAIKDVYESEKNFPDKLDFGAFHGHLMALKSPEEYNQAWQNRYDTSILPMIPGTFEYKPDDVESVNKLMAKIRDGHYDFLVNACDAGREGEHIFWSFYECMGLNLPVKRLWASSVTKPGLKSALQNLQPASLYDGMRQAAKYRAQFDWLVGMNFTRAASSGLHKFVPIGRVQSPTLKLLVDRELEIRNFVPADFFEVKSEVAINASGKTLFKHLIAPKHTDTHFATEAEAKKIADEVRAAKQGTVLDVKEVVKSTDAPNLYSLAELEKDANKYFKFPPKKTDAIAQSLYEKGYTTYPRAESRFLPTDMVPEIPQHLAVLNVVPELAAYVSKIGQAEIDGMLKKGYVDDTGVTDHHAIIPTDSAPVWEQLSADEQKLYTLIGKSFIAIFLPPYKAASSSIYVEIGGHWFVAKGKREIDKGYGVLYATGKSKDVLLPACKKGDPVEVLKVTIAKSTTAPPKRYSPASIIEAMQHAGNTLDNKALRSVLRESAGLGTVASRSEILQKLEDRGFVEVKSNAYYALDKGIDIIQNIGERNFASPILTAQWEEKLHAIESNSYHGDFRTEMEAYIKDETAFLLANLKGAAERKIVGKCPVCGGNILEVGKSYMCENRKKDDPNSCPIWFPKSIGGYDFTENDINTLLSFQKTEPHELKTKAGALWNVQMYLDATKGLMMENCNTSVGACPICGKSVIAVGNAYMCEDARSESPENPGSCTFWMARTIGGYALTQEDIDHVLQMQQTDIRTIKRKDGSAWKVRFTLDANKKLSLINAEERVERTCVGKCPQCGKPVYAAANNYYCDGFRDKSCDYSFPKTIKGTILNDSDVEALLAGKKTRWLSFVWASGKKGQARLYLTKGKLQWEFADKH